MLSPLLLDEIQEGAVGVVGAGALEQPLRRGLGKHAPRMHEDYVVAPQ
jgi:hypothetical protein